MGAFTSLPIQQVGTAAATAELPFGCVINPKGLHFSKNVVFNGQAQDQDQAWIFEFGALFGTAKQPGNGIISPNQISIGGDVVDTTTLGNGNLIGFSVSHAVSAGHTGGREALQGFLQVVGSPALAAGGAGYVGAQGQLRINCNLGGIAGVYANYKGGVFGGNSNVFAQTGATFLNLINGHEFDITLPIGASSADKYGVSVVHGASDAVRGTYDDAAISINDQDAAAGVTAVGWLRGISFGSYAHKWAFAADSTLIGAQLRQTGPASPCIALWGIDFSAVAFQAGGGFLNSTGFSVDPSGNLTAASARINQALSVGAKAQARFFPMNINGTVVNVLTD